MNEDDSKILPIGAIPTFSNLNLQRQQGISLELLLKTFVEAVAVSRRFSMPYLWIDWLCIIQDSVADWRVEAASMGDVYSNSRLNIMATGSRKSHEGLFRSRDLKHLALCIVESQ